MAIFGKLPLAPNQRGCSSQLNWHILARNGKCSKQMKDCVGGVIFRWLKGSKLCPENGPSTMSVPKHPQGMMFKGSKQDILLVNKFFAMEHLENTCFLWEKRGIFDVDVCLQKGTNWDCSIQLAKSSQTPPTYSTSLYFFLDVVFLYMLEIVRIFHGFVSGIIYPKKKLAPYIFLRKRHTHTHNFSTLSSNIFNLIINLPRWRRWGRDSDLGILWFALQSGSHGWLKQIPWRIPMGRVRYIYRSMNAWFFYGKLV